MVILRFFSALSLMIGVVALVDDATPYWSGTGPFHATSFLEHWSRLSPATLDASRKAMTGAAGAWLWIGIEFVLSHPTWLLLGLVSVLLGYLGRHRRRINVFVN